MGYVEDLTRGKEVYSTGMRGEIDRIGKALEFAMEGRKTVVVSSGDSGVYGMAGLIFEMLTPEQEEALEISVLPGITAACSAAALNRSPAHAGLLQHFPERPSGRQRCNNEKSYRRCGGGFRYRAL